MTDLVMRIAQATGCPVTVRGGALRFWLVPEGDRASPAWTRWAPWYR